MATFEAIEFLLFFRADFDSPGFQELEKHWFRVEIPGKPLRWALKPDARREALATFATAEEARQTRATAPGPDESDPIQRALDRLLRGERIDIEKMTEDELILAEQLATWLHGLPLGQELGIPDPVLIRSHLSLLRQVKPLAKLTPGPFVGREHILERLRSYCFDESGVAQPLVMWGDAGVGKSALAARIALEFLGAAPADDLRRSAFRCGRTRAPGVEVGPVVFIDLNQRTLWRDDLRQQLVKESSRQLAAQAPLKEDLPDAEPPVAADLSALLAFYRSLWGSRKLLFVLDGYERIIEAGESMHQKVWSLLSELAQGLPAARVLVISRELPSKRSMGPADNIASSDRSTSYPLWLPDIEEQFELTDLERAESDRLLFELGVWEKDTPSLREIGAGNPRTLRRLVDVYLDLVVRRKPLWLVPSEFRRRWGSSWTLGTTGPDKLPDAPEAYVAHPYMLLRTHGLIGRQGELDSLTAWATGTDLFRRVNTPVLCVCASGGMGKSALTWHWFKNVAPEVGSGWKGRIWWSFYEADSDFEAFVTRALAYVSGQTVEQVAVRSFADQLDDLFNALDSSRFLIVLDGFERQLAAYSRLNQAAVDADDNLEEEVNNYVRGMYRLSSAGFGPPARRVEDRPPNEQRATNITEGCRQFLRRLAKLNHSRVVLSTRLFPADFQEETGEMLAGVVACNLDGLANSDATAFWMALGGRGAGGNLADWFRDLRMYPLLIQALAGVVVSDFDARGDFEKWHSRHTDFNPFAKSTAPSAVRDEILTFAIRNLPSRESFVLAHMAALRMSSGFETLHEVIVGPTGDRLDPEDLRDALGSLHRRGLVSWSEADFRFDLHPVVRCVAFADLRGAMRNAVIGRLTMYFSRFPRPVSLHCQPQEIMPHLEYYFLLIMQGRWDAAAEQFKSRLMEVSRTMFGSMPERLLWLAELFESRSFAEPLRVSRPDLRGHTLLAVADTMIFLSMFDQALEMLELALIEQVPDPALEANLQRNLAYTLFAQGRFAEAELAAKRSLISARTARDSHAEARSLIYLLWVYLRIGDLERATAAYERARSLLVPEEEKDASNMALLDSELYLETNRLPEASDAADKLLKEGERTGYEYGIAAAHARLAIIAMGTGDLDGAKGHLDEAHRHSVSCGFVSKETDVLIQYGRLLAARQDWPGAQKKADQVILRTEKGAHKLGRIEAYALRALAISRLFQAGLATRAEAVASARTAYQLAWCDGPPYVYRRFLQEAGGLLLDLDEPLPTGLPRYDPARYESVDLEIDPPATETAPERVDASELTPQEMQARVAELKDGPLDWKNALLPARKWWDRFESGNDFAQVFRLARDLVQRSVTLTEFVDASGAGGTDDPTAGLHYLDFLRVKNRESESQGFVLKPSRPTTEAGPSIRLAELKAKLGWEKTTGSARRWWVAFEEKHEPSVVEGLAEALAERGASIPEYFLAYVYSNSEDDEANLHYLDYMRAKKAAQARHAKTA
jgi:tetratricopeptide (TPR) repeat protein